MGGSQGNSNRIHTRRAPPNPIRLLVFARRAISRFAHPARSHKHSPHHSNTAQAELVPAQFTIWSQCTTMTPPRARGALIATVFPALFLEVRPAHHRTTCPGQTPPECRSTALAPARRGAVRRLPTGLLTPSSRPALPRHRAARGLSGSDLPPPPHCAGSTHAGVHSHSAHHRPRGQSRPCAPGRGSPSHHPSGQPLSPRQPSTRAPSPSDARPAHPCSRSPAAANDPSNANPRLLVPLRGVVRPSICPASRPISISFRSGMLPPSQCSRISMGDRLDPQKRDHDGNLTDTVATLGQTTRTRHPPTAPRSRNHQHRTSIYRGNRQPRPESPPLLI